MILESSQFSKLDSYCLSLSLRLLLSLNTIEIRSSAAAGDADKRPTSLNPGGDRVDGGSFTKSKVNGIRGFC